MNLNNTVPYLLAAALAAAASPSFARGDATSGEVKSKELGCQTCHGPDGNGATPAVPGVPRLAGQYADYMVRALIDYRTGKRTNPIMSGFASALSPIDRENIAAFYASQPGLRVLHQ